MLSEREVRDIFVAELPGVDIANVGRVPFVEQAMKHAFIRKQIEVGIYDEQNIYTDFLGVACSFVPLNRVEYSYELISLVAENVPNDITRRWLEMLAHHEAHHFKQQHRPMTWEQHAVAELECNDHMDASAETDFAEHSVTYIRVLLRIKLIEKGLRP